MKVARDWVALARLRNLWLGTSEESLRYEVARLFEAAPNDVYVSGLLTAADDARMRDGVLAARLLRRSDHEGEGAKAVAETIIRSCGALDDALAAVRLGAPDAAARTVALLPWKASPNDAAVEKLMARIRARI